MPPTQRWPAGTSMKLRSRDDLKDLMETKGFSRRRLARYCGLRGASMIDHLIDGRRDSCSPRLATRIAEALDVSLGLIFLPRTPTVSRSRTYQRASPLPAA